MAGNRCSFVRLYQLKEDQPGLCWTLSCVTDQNHIPVFWNQLSFIWGMLTCLTPLLKSIKLKLSAAQPKLSASMGKAQCHQHCTSGCVSSRFVTNPASLSVKLTQHYGSYRHDTTATGYSITRATAGPSSKACIATMTGHRPFWNESVRDNIN